MQVLYILTHNDPKRLSLDVHKSGTIYSLSEKKNNSFISKSLLRESPDPPLFLSD